MKKELQLSNLSKTWIFDLDGTIVEHNGYKKYGEDVLLDGVAEFFATIPSDDMIIILTARESKYKDSTINFLQKHNGILHFFQLFEFFANFKRFFYGYISDLRK